MGDSESTDAMRRIHHIARRIQKITPEATHSYFYDGWLLVKEVVASTNGTTDVVEYHWGNDLSGSRGGAAGVGGLLYIAVSNSSSHNSSTHKLYIPWYDNNGNIWGYWDERGKVAATFSYGAFGETVASGDNPDKFPIRFSTKYHDVESGLYYYTKRFYSPALRRWLTRDPIGENGGVNLYAMCGNNAIIYFDALGETKVKLTTSVEARNSSFGILPFVAIRMTVVDPPQTGHKLYFIQLRKNREGEWKIDNVNSMAGPYYYSQIDRYQVMI